MSASRFVGSLRSYPGVFFFNLLGRECPISFLFLYGVGQLVRSTQPYTDIRSRCVLRCNDGITKTILGEMYCVRRSVTHGALVFIPSGHAVCLLRTRIGTAF